MAYKAGSWRTATNDHNFLPPFLNQSTRMTNKTRNFAWQLLLILIE